MIGLQHYLILSAILFVIGLVGALTKKHVVAILMSIEILFNAVNIALVAFSRYIEPVMLTGQVFALFVITVAAAEVALGLALLIAIFRRKETVDISQVNEMKN